MISGIYTITCLVNNKIYVGESINVFNRKNQHFSALKQNKHTNTYLQTSYNKHGIKNFRFELLVECENKLLFSEEHYWATILNVHNRNYGYNILLTNPNIENRFHCEETKLKISKSKKGNSFCKNLVQLIEINKNREYKKGYQLSEEHKNKISKSVVGKRKGIKFSENHKKKLSETKLGKKSSEKTKQKQSFSLKGLAHNITENGKRNSSINRGGPVLQYDLNMILIKKWDCTYDIEKQLKLSIRHIRSCCTEKKKTAFGFIWRYENKLNNYK